MKRVVRSALPLALLALLLAPPAAAVAKTERYPVSSAEALAIANRVPKIDRMLADHPQAAHDVQHSNEGRWRVQYYDDGKEVGVVRVDDRTGAVVDAWTGIQVQWGMARGVPGAFGRHVNAVYVWIPLMLIFFFGLFDWRRPWQLVHLDLLVLLSLSVSQYFFNRGAIYTSVPLVYPVLVYVLLRMLATGFSRRVREHTARWRPRLPIVYLALALVFLCTFRIALNVTDSNVIDVGYSGVIGADYVIHDKPLYGEFPRGNQSGDTYGPVNYYAYVPEELIYPWHGKWDDLPAAHLAAVLFDLAVIGGLLLLGRRLRSGRAGTELGVVLAFAWTAFPYSLAVMNSNANDSLVAALLVFTLAFAARPAVRGIFWGLAAATKFAPVMLGPLFATYCAPARGPRWMQAVVFVFVATITLFVVFLPVTLNANLPEFYDRTIGFQLGRGSPFSIWGQNPGLDWLQTTFKVVAAALAVAVAFVPRRKDPVVLAALGAAVLIALQLTFTHWFYLYVVWWLPYALIATLATGVSSPRARETARSTQPARPSPR